MTSGHARRTPTGSRVRAIGARLLDRLPPRPAWLLWRAVTVPTAARRRVASGPEVDLAVVAWGVDGYELGRLIERLSEAGGGAERLVVVSDSDAVGVAAASGCRFEHVPPRADWEARMTGHDYDEVAAERVRVILDDYGVGRLAVVGDLPPALRASLPQAKSLAAGASEVPAG